MNGCSGQEVSHQTKRFPTKRGGKRNGGVLSKAGGMYGALPKATVIRCVIPKKQEPGNFFQRMDNEHDA